MRRIPLLLVLLMATCPLFASTYWYNGDFNGVNGLANEVNTTITQYAYVYDDFVVSGGGVTLTGAFSNVLTDILNIGTADVEIRSGVSLNNGGTLVYGAYNVAATETATGRSGFGYNEYTIHVDLPNLNLAPGTYWLMVAPHGFGSGRAFISTTSGAGCIGSPCGNDDNSFFTSDYFGTYFDAASNWVGFPADFSMGVEAGTPPLPEPSSLMLLGSGLLGLTGLLRRRSKL